MPEKSFNFYEESILKNDLIPEEWQSQSSLDELAKFLQLNWEQRAIFYDDGDISSKQHYLSFIGKQGLRTNNYVGTIAFRGRQLNIFPKVFREDKDDTNTNHLTLQHLMKNLVQWLKYCAKIDFPFISILGKLENSEDLRELFITLYLHYVKQALYYAPYYRYVDKIEDVEAIKGHINFKNYINQKIPNGKNNKFLCSFSDFEFDNNVNRIIKYTCRSLITTTNSTENRKIIRQVIIQLNQVSDVRCVPADCDGIRLSKMHRQYSVLMSMSKMFLLNQTTTYQLDNQNSFCFLFPTHLLFEGFIGGFIEEVLMGHAKVRLQSSELMLIADVVYNGLSLGKAFTMRHDILVEHKIHGLFLLDTKYKHLTRFEGNDDVKRSVTTEVKQQDLYQIIEYASNRDLDKAYLLYPMYRFEDDEPTCVILERKSVSGKQIFVYIVRVPFIFEDDYEATKESLRKSILQIFT